MKLKLPLFSFGTFRGVPCRYDMIIIFLASSLALQDRRVTSITIMLVLAGVLFKGPFNLSEWDACDKPLGIWGSLCIPRVLLVLLLLGDISVIAPCELGSVVSALSELKKIHQVFSSGSFAKLFKLGLSRTVFVPVLAIKIAD